MNRWFLVLALVAMAQWCVFLVAMILGQPISLVRPWIDQVTAMTVAVHLIGACRLGWTRTAPSPVDGPGWALVQAEKHRRKGQVFAVWGLIVSASWLLVRPDSVADGDPIGWQVGLVVAVNAVFQPGVLVAEAVAINARVKLGQMLITTRV